MGAEFACPVFQEVRVSTEETARKQNSLGRFGIRVHCVPICLTAIFASANPLGLDNYAASCHVS
jgi:hypothetical protein